MIWKKSYQFESKGNGISANKQNVEKMKIHNIGFFYLLCVHLSPFLYDYIVCSRSYFYEYNIKKRM